MPQVFANPPQRFFTGITQDYLYASMLEISEAIPVAEISLAVQTDQDTTASQALRVALFGANASREPDTLLGTSGSRVFSGRTQLPDLSGFSFATPVTLTPGVYFLVTQAGELSHGDEPVIHLGYRDAGGSPPQAGTYVAPRAYALGMPASWSGTTGTGSSHWTCVLSEAASAALPESGPKLPTLIKRIWPTRGFTSAQAVIDETRFRLRDTAKAFVSDDELLLHLQDALRAAYPSYQEGWALEYVFEADDSYSWPLTVELPEGYDGEPLAIQWRNSLGWITKLNSYTYNPVSREINLWAAPAWFTSDRCTLIIKTLGAPRLAVSRADAQISVSHKFLVESVVARALPQVQALSREDRLLDMQNAGLMAAQELMRSARGPTVYDDGTLA